MTKLEQAVEAHKKNDFKRAEELINEVLKVEPDNSDALHLYGLAKAENHQIDAGISFILKALKIQPENAVFNYNLGVIYSTNGLIDKAIKYFEKTIQFKPDYCEAYQSLADSKKFNDDHSLLEKIEIQLNSNKLTDDQKSHLYFAAGKIYSDQKNYDNAFNNYKRANSYKNASFDIEKDYQYNQNKIKFFNKDWVLSKKEFGLFSRIPIFIVGMPRSGSTLAEQILSAHSDVFGAGELRDIGLIINALRHRTKSKLPDPVFLQETLDMDLLGYGTSYLNKLDKLSNNQARVINKNLLNFKHVGLILLMFPNAKIIHTTRDPLDTCLSCFFQNFKDKTLSYSFNLKNLAAYYNNYKTLMSHWESIFPDKIYTLNYESLIGDQEKISRDLIAFCELDWQDGCLSFQENKRNVRTASKYQVRHSLYSNSIKRWQSYEDHLTELIVGLHM